MLYVACYCRLFILNKKNTSLEKTHEKSLRGNKENSYATKGTAETKNGYKKQVKQAVNSGEGKINR